MKKANQILILCSRLDLPGGTERAITNMANMFAVKEHKVTIAILDETLNSYYKLNNGIEIFSKPLHFGIITSGNVLTRKYAFVKHIFLLKKIVSQIKPDLIISTDYPYSIALVLGRTSRYAKLISWEPHHFYWLKKNKFWRTLLNKTYPRLDRIVCLNEREKKVFEKLKCKTAVIPGLIPDFPAANGDLNSRQLLTVGWFIKRKGIDLIPIIGEMVFKKYPDWKWILIGEGEEKEALLFSLQERNLTTNFIILEPVSHDTLEEIYASASIYVLTSRSEAFPAVLIESMAHGIPAVAFDCLTGPSDIIKDGEDGILVEEENVGNMTKAIFLLIEQRGLRKRMGAKAAINVQRFSQESIYSLWAQLFEKL